MCPDASSGVGWSSAVIWAFIWKDHIMPVNSKLLDPLKDYPSLDIGGVSTM